MDNSLTQKYIDELAVLRDSRLDNLADRGSLNEIIADLMNALEITYIVVNERVRRESPQAD